MNGTPAPTPRVAIITTIPAPYRDQLFDRLRPRVGSLDVYYSEPRTTDRQWNTAPVDADHELPALIRRHGQTLMNRGILRVVRRSDVVVIGGYDQPACIVAAVLSRLLRRRLVLFYDGVAPSRFERGGALLRLKRLIAGMPQVCLVNGTVGRRYFAERLRVPTDRLRNQYLVPLDSIRSDEQMAPRHTDVLYAGRLVERKGVGLMLDAVHDLPGLRVVIGGSGPELDHLQHAARDLDVTFLGEIDAEHVRRAMSDARCVVLVSTDEPWGLVVQEAMQCGAAVVVSADVGCGPDLVVDGANGAIAHADTPAGVRDAIRRALAIPPATIAATNQRILAEWNIDAHVDAFANAILST